MSLAQKCPVGLKVSLAQEMSSELVGSEVRIYLVGSEVFSIVLSAQRCPVNLLDHAIVHVAGSEVYSTVIGPVMF